SGRPPLSIIMISPGFAATMACVPRCCFDLSRPTGLIFMVTARPAIFGQGHMGRTPNVVFLSSKRSIPSETAQVSSLAKRSMIASRVIKILRAVLHPVRETHAAAGRGRRTVGRHVFEVFQLH